MRVFCNGASLLAALFGILQQAVAASSTYFITRAGGSILGGGPFLFWLALFLASLVAVFVPSFAWNFFLNKSKYRSFAACMDLCGRQLYNHPVLHSSRRFCEARQPYFHNQCWGVVNEACDFFSDLLQVSCSVLFNVAVISAMLDPLFLLGYSGSLAVAAAGLLLARRKAQDLSRAAQERQAHMQEALLSGWDTILTGNRCNFRAWRRAFDGRVRDAGRAQQRAVVFSSAVNLATMALSVLPVAAVILHYFFTRRDDPQALMMLAVTLPRQVGIVQYLSTLIEYAMTLAGLAARIRQMEDAIKPPADTAPFCGRIRWDQLSLHSAAGQESCRSFADLSRGTRAFSPGRYTLRGPNGSGKSTVLMQCKEQMGDAACYLPAASSLYFDTTAHAGGSTGEKLLRQLRELLDSPDSAQVTVLLLDEWDANLDAGNVARVSSLLEQTAAKKCVLEVRHRTL